MFQALSLLMLAQVPPQYDAAYDRALRVGKPLIVGIGCAAPAGPWVHVHVRSLTGFTAPCIVVSEPVGRDVIWRATLPAYSSAKAIGRSLTPKAPAPVKPAPKFNPYQQPNYQHRMDRERQVSPVSRVRGVSSVAPARAGNC